MEILKKTASTVKNNIVGAIAGGVAGYFVAKKAIKTEKKWLLGVIVLVGAGVGATAQSKFFAKKGSPTATSVTKK